MSHYSDIDPQDIDPDTGRPYSNYSSPSLDTSFHDHEADVGDLPTVEEAALKLLERLGIIVENLPQAQREAANELSEALARAGK